MDDSDCCLYARIDCTGRYIKRAWSSSAKRYDMARICFYARIDT